MIKGIQFLNLTTKTSQSLSYKYQQCQLQAPFKRNPPLDKVISTLIDVMEIFYKGVWKIPEKDFLLSQIVRQQLK